MELFFLLSDLQAKNLFYEKFLAFKKGIQNWFWKQELEANFLSLTEPQKGAGRACLEGVCKVSWRCLECIWKVFGMSVEGVYRVIVENCY